MSATPPPAFDSLVLAAVAEEIGGLAGARVSGIAQADHQTVGVLFGGRRSSRGVVCSIDARWARCLVSASPPGALIHPFAHQLKARLSGARLLSATVPPFERVITLTFETLEGPLHLISEIMGRHSNLLLVEAGRVAGIFKTVTPAMSRVRPLHPGSPYQPPPARRPTPETVTPAALADLLEGGAAVADTLARGVLGISPPLAYHVAMMVGIDPQRPGSLDQANALLPALRTLAELASARAFDPVQYTAANGTSAAYAAIPLLTYRDLAARHTGSMSHAASGVIDALARATALADRRRSLAARIAEEERRVDRAEAEVKRALDEAGDPAQWRRWGELLLAYGSTVPQGAEAATVPDFDGTPVTIPLDRRHSPVQNAQRLFRRHGKAAATRRALPPRLEALAAERAYLETLQVMATQAAGTDEIELLSAEVPERAQTSAPRRRAPPAAAPRVFTTAAGLRILAGRSNRENEHVTFTLGRPDDLWLHARGMPGAHVILQTGGRAAPSAAVEAAASVAAYYSGGRSAGKVPVDVTARRHVRKMRGGRPGMVTYREERTIVAEPRLPAADVQERAPAARGGARESR